MNNETESKVKIRRATITDVPEIKKIIDIYAGKILLSKNLITLYEQVQEFWVAELDTEIIGCGAIHVLWCDLGEIRTLALRPEAKGKKIGDKLVTTLLQIAKELKLKRIFVLTFQVEFFKKYGFYVIEGTPVSPKVYKQMLQSYDTGTAEFLDLSFVKPNTLGNTRMLLDLN